jgi:vacuolar-type H+-ATPase subunit I/STV1
MILPKTINDEIWDYCRTNGITNIDEFIIKLVKQGFTIEKYGATPQSPEKIVEKIVEVPVERIVEKEIYITNDEEVKKLTDKVVELTNELETVKQELETERKKKKDIYGES